MSWIAPTVEEFKARFVRDFPYAHADDQTNTDYVLDADITTAMNTALVHFNDSIGADDAGLTEMFLLLAAYFLVENLKSAAKGIAGQADFLVNSKSVGSVSISTSVPEDFLKDPMVAGFTANRYGMQFLQLMFPLMRGRVVVMRGSSTSA